MEIAICALLAYIFLGVSQVTKDLGASVMERPIWAMSPTWGKVILFALTWPYRFVIESSDASGRLARAIAFGVLDFATKMAVLTAFIWGSYTVAGLIFENLAFQLLLSAVIALVGSFIVLPLATLAMIPVTILLAWPLDILFPLKSNSSGKDIDWCRSCRHYRKVSEYEDSMHGEDSIPRSDKLPCKIVLETSMVWEAYYEAEPKARSLFPKNCPRFER